MQHTPFLLISSLPALNYGILLIEGSLPNNLRQRIIFISITIVILGLLLSIGLIYSNKQSIPFLNQSNADSCDSVARCPIVFSASKILTSVKNLGTTEVFLVSIDGKSFKNLSETHPLTYNGIVQGGLNPTFSTDYKKIAYVAPDPKNSQNSQIFIMDFDGSNKAQLTNSSGSKYAPSWSPDGKKLIYTTLKAKVFVLTIYDFSAKVESFVNKTGFISIETPQWLSDGSGYSYVGLETVEGGQPAREFVIYKNNSDTIIPVVYQNKRKYGVSNPSVSPDQKKVVFSMHDDTLQYQVYTMNVNGSDVKRLTNDKTITYLGTTWSSDGITIVTTALKQDYTSAVVLIDTAGNQVNKISETGYGGFNWAKMGRY